MCDISIISHWLDFGVAQRLYEGQGRASHRPKRCGLSTGVVPRQLLQPPSLEAFLNCD